MRKLIVLTFVSLDGVMQAPGGSEEDSEGGFKYGGWTVPYFDDVAGKVMGEQMDQPFDLLLGRWTYDLFASYWPKHADKSPSEQFDKATKYVVTNRPLDITWDKSVVIDGDVVSKIKDLKSSDGPMLQVHGSGNMVQTLLRHDLIDELWLKIFPVTLGPGKRLFGEGTVPAAYDLIGSQVSPSGVIFANYRRSGDVETGTFD